MPNPLASVAYWAYQIQHLDRAGAVQALVSSKYDMLVLEPTRTDRDTTDFDSKGMVQALHATSGRSGNLRIVLAYVDIGEAESWRYYWKSSWEPPTNSERGNPDFLIIPDPDGWADNYPVAFWDQRWKDIIIYNPDSMLQKVLDDGYDGIYMDWVEAYSDDAIEQEAARQGKDAAAEMVKFIGEIRAHARKQNPGFLVVAQNAAELAASNPSYLSVVDGIAQEQIYFDGDADTGWNDPSACDQPVPKQGLEYSRAFYHKTLAVWQQAGLPVFNVEYACDPDNVSASYSLSEDRGFVPYVSRRPLSRLTADPPPGY